MVGDQQLSGLSGFGHGLAVAERVVVVNPEVDPCVRVETEDVPVSLSVGDFHAVDHEEFRVLNFAPVQEGRGGVVVGRNDAVESRSLAERDDFGRRQPSVRVDRMYMGCDAVPAGFVVQLRSRVRRRGEFFFARGPSVRVIFSVQSVVRPAVVGIWMTVHRPGLIRPAR